MSTRGDDEASLASPMRRSLLGIREVAVSVEVLVDPNDSRFNDGQLVTDSFGDAIEKQLHDAGVPLTSLKDATLFSKKGAVLSLKLVCWPVPAQENGVSKLMVSHMQLQIEQPVRPVNNPQVLIPQAVTWSVSSTAVGQIGAWQTVQKSADDLTQKFITAYFSTHMRR